MSSNNELVINKTKTGFRIDDVCIDTGCGIKVGTTKTLRQAINKAKEYMKDNLVEYGIAFGDLK